VGIAQGMAERERERERERENLFDSDNQIDD